MLVLVRSGAWDIASFIQLGPTARGYQILETGDAHPVFEYC
jgi:hypothetical protein